MENIIITGASGMIGSAIIKEALKLDIGVTAVVRKNSRNMGNLPDAGCCSKFRVIECDQKDLNSLDTGGAKHDVFIHMAWEGARISTRDDVYTHIDNIKYTIDAVHAAHRAGCSVFIDAGSQAEYGRVSVKLCGSTTCNPESGYGIAKYAAGKMASLAASQLGMRFCHVRILSVYGEGMAGDTVIIYLIKTLLEGKKPSLTKCEQLWDYMYVQDVAKAFLAIAESGVDGKVYPLGTGVTKPLYEYFEVIRDMICPETELGFGEIDYYPHQPMYLCADIDELCRDTGFKPAISFEEGIRNTIDWVKMRMKEGLYK